MHLKNIPCNQHTVFVHFGVVLSDPGNLNSDPHTMNSTFERICSQQHASAGGLLSTELNAGGGEESISLREGDLTSFWNATWTGSPAAASAAGGADLHSGVMVSDDLDKYLTSDGYAQ
eukprot:COSAG02_NODE_45743_length_354_cov_1.003922_1_plen_117_part_11